MSAKSSKLLKRYVDFLVASNPSASYNQLLKLAKTYYSRLSPKDREVFHAYVCKLTNE